MEKNIVNLVCEYVRSFSDTWAHLIKITATAAARNNNNNNISYPEFCNPLFKISCNVSSSVNSSTQITFATKVDDKNAVSQTAILMFALDSFMSLVASSRETTVDSSKEDNTFTIKVPCDASGESLLNNEGFPAGLCGPFRRWSFNFKSANLSGKSGIAGITAAALTIIENELDVSGTEILERMNTITAAVQQLDDSEMGRTLSRNKNSGVLFSVSSTRQANQQLRIKEKNNNKTRKRSRRKGDCSANPLSFVDKFVGNVKTLGIKGRSQPLPSSEFTSLFMTGAEADACYQNFQSMRGANRMRSLLVKYCHLMTENDLGWEWSSPEERKLIVVAPNGSEQILHFRLICEKSETFEKVTSTSNNIKQWIRTTAKILENLNQLREFLPQMGTAASYSKENLLKTLAGLFTLRDTVGFRIPENIKNWLPKTWNAPMSTMGVTSCRFEKIMEVMDTLINGGAFVNSCLNNAFFYESGIDSHSSQWPHKDAIKLATAVLAHISKNTGGNFYCMSSPSSTPIIINDSGITIKKPENAIISDTPLLTRQSIDSTVVTIIQIFSDVSSNLRKRNIHHHVSEFGNVSVGNKISRLGAFKTLMEITVAGNRFSDDVDNNYRSKREMTREETYVKRPRREQPTEEFQLEGIRKSAATAALIFTRPGLDNAMLYPDQPFNPLLGPPARNRRCARDEKIV